MTERKKQKTAPKKRTETVPRGKTPEKTGTTSRGKGEILRSPKLAKRAKKKTTASRKPGGNRPAIRRQAAVTAKSKAKAGTKTKKAVIKRDPQQELRKVLLGKKESIVREAKEEIAKYVSGENRQLVDTALDEGDWAVVDISEDVNLMRLAAHRKAMHDIDEALRKISEGSYGICEECGEEIGAKRLSVLPAATLCVSCQGNKEQLEAIEKEEPSV
jgi:DnaK suppressor protein